VRYASAVLFVVLLSVGCATTSNPYAYNEMESCPSAMSDEQHMSGVVRCRALCSSYARDFAEYTPDCKCWCAPASGPGGYRAKPRQQAQQPWSEGQTLWTPSSGNGATPL
jgi:hypothetical protein